ncbi:MAG: ABC transporter ATP-binding protein [Oscillospiraceae bacterium]|nr:ABC transporter ATP-binding protein [Oscillospiraceae bacterium]
MSNDILFNVQNVSRLFFSGGEEVHALNDVSIDIPKEQLIILRGRSGSGKTTLINILGALDRPTSGNVLFEGKEITGFSDRKQDEYRRKNVGFVFQSVALMSTMSAFENVEFGLRIAGMPYAEQKERVKECLSIVGLDGRMYHHAHELSGGEQQRVAIARAVAHRPVVVLADEPTAELDTTTGLQVVRFFKEIIKEQGTTVIMATHDPNMVEIGDMVIDLEDGKVVEELTKNESS